MSLRLEAGLDDYHNEHAARVIEKLGEFERLGGLDHSLIVNR